MIATRLSESPSVYVVFSLCFSPSVCYVHPISLVLTHVCVPMSMPNSVRLPWQSDPEAPRAALRLLRPTSDTLIAEALSHFLSFSLLRPLLQCFFLQPGIYVILRLFL